MKKICVVFCLAIFLCFAGCKEESSKADSEPLNLLQSVFESKSEFITEENEKVFLKDFPFAAAEYVYVDLNGDQKDELVLYEEKENSYLVFLRKQRGTKGLRFLFGYELSFKY